MHQSITLWVNEQQGDMQDSKSIGRRLQSLNKSLFSQQIALTTRNLGLIHWTMYEISLGGKFPREAYVSALSDVQMLTTCMALMTHATRGIDYHLPASTFSVDDAKTEPVSQSVSAKQEKWIRQLARVTQSTEFDAHTITSILLHLAGAISNNSALPPHLIAPSSFFLTQKVRESNVQAMHIENIQHSDFMAFASMEVAASLLNRRLNKLIDNVKGLVGEINFNIDALDREAKDRKTE